MDKAMAGSHKPKLEGRIIQIDPSEELWSLVRRVAEHFEYTDAPLGIEAKRLLDFYGRNNV